MKKLLIILALAAAAFSGASCLNGGFSSKYTVLDDFEVSSFIASCPDSVFFDSYFVGSSRSLLYNVNGDPDKKVATGGFALSWKRDRTVGSTAELCNQYCVLNSATGEQSMFAVYYQNPDPALNPKEGLDIAFLGNATDTCSPVGLYVANTAQVATLISNGSETFEPFREGDYLRVVFTGFKDEVKGKSVTVDLAKFAGALTLVNEWKKVDLSALGMVTSIDIQLETNREGLPLYVCIDNVVATVTEEG